MNTPKSKRQGGRIKSAYPEFLKKLRATQEEQDELFRLLRSLNPTGNTRIDFMIILNSIKATHIPSKTPPEKGKSHE